MKMFSAAQSFSGEVRIFLSGLDNILDLLENKGKRLMDALHLMLHVL